MFEGCVAHCEHIVDPGHRFGQFNAPADWRSCAKACVAPVSKSSGAAISCGFDHSQLDGRLRFIAFVREIGLCSPPVVAAETSISFRPSRSCFGHCRLFRTLKSKIEWQQHNQMKIKISEWLEFWSCGKEFSRRIGVVGQFTESSGINSCHSSRFSSGPNGRRRRNIGRFIRSSRCVPSCRSG